MLYTSCSINIVAGIIRGNLQYVYYFDPYLFLT